MLIGREAECAVVEQLVAGARLGRGGVLVITGEAGVGKSALLAHAAGLATGMGLLRAVGSEPEREIPFGALDQVLRPTLQHLDDIPAPQAAALSTALALRPGSAVDRFAVGAATLSLVCRHAEARPVALLLDDVHLFDRPSVAALAFAARRLAADPVVLFAGARPTDVFDQLSQLPHLALAGLDVSAASALVARHSPVAVTPARLARLHHLTAGNPLALIELVGAADRLDDASPAAPLPVPATLVTAFASRARSLGPAARTAVAVAAVAGTDLRLVTAACRAMGTQVEALDEAVNAGLVQITGGGVEFRHPLVRAAVYGELTPQRRRSVHRAVAEALGPGEPDRQAWHLAEAALGPDRDVAELLAGAARRAGARGAYDVAATAFERAARLSLERHDEYLVTAAESAWLAGAGPRAIALLDTVSDTSAVRLRAHELRGAIAARTGSLTTSRDILRAAAGEATDPDAVVVLLADAISVCFYLGDAATATELADAIEAVLDQVEAATPRALGLTAVGVARILANRGGIEQLRAATQLLAGSDDLRADQRRTSWLLLGPLFLRDADSGNELRRAVRRLRAEAAVGALPFLLFHVARDEATTDQWARAEATYDEAVRLARETGQDTELAMCLAALAWLQARLGRDEQCRALVDEALGLCVARDIHLGRIWSLFALADLDLGLGRPSDALIHLTTLTDLLSALGLADPDLSPVPELADVLSRLGRRAEATDAARRFHHAATVKGQPWALARAERALGTVGPDADLDHHFGTALALHARTLDGFETARTRLAYGARLRRGRRRADARPQLRAALAAFDELGARGWADQAAAEFEATGETIHRPSGRPALTAQELQVCLQLADGRTTREVAAALFLSPKTVEYHLRKVYTKLGLRSRAELATHLHRVVGDTRPG